MPFQSILRRFRKAWASTLIKRVDVKGRTFMLAFKVFQDGEGERKVLLAGRHLGGDGETYSMKPDEFDRFLEAALAVKAALHDGEHSQP